MNDPTRIGLDDCSKSSGKTHDPTQGMRQGNDIGTQYRSAIYVYGAEDLRLAQSTRDAFQTALDAATSAPSPLKSSPPLPSTTRRSTTSSTSRRTPMVIAAWAGRVWLAR